MFWTILILQIIKQRLSFAGNCFIPSKTDLLIESKRNLYATMTKELFLFYADLVKFSFQ